MTVVLPLDAQARDTFLESLAVFVIHSDGEKNVIEGAITYDANSNPAGICIQVISSHLRCSQGRTEDHSAYHRQSGCDGRR